MSYIVGKSVDSLGGIVSMGGRTAPAVSPAAQARIFCDGTQLLSSVNGGPYAALAGQSTVSQINGNGSTITEGQVVYHTTTAGTVALATAAADAPAARAFGVVVDTSILNTASGSIALVGQRRILRFEPSLTLVNGNEIYLSATTPGSVTNVAPATTGQVIQTLGVIDDSSAYVSGPGPYLAYVIFTLGPKAVA